MEYLKYCFGISIFVLIFDIIWRLLSIVLLLVIAPVELLIQRLSGMKKIVGFVDIFILDLLRCYLFNSIIFTLSFYSISTGKRREDIILYLITGTLFVVAYFVNGIRTKREKVLEKLNPKEALKIIKSQVILSISFFILYITMFLIPLIGVNYVSNSIFKLTSLVINWIWQLNLIGVIFGILGIFFVLSLFLTAVLPKSVIEDLRVSNLGSAPSMTEPTRTSSSPISSRSNW